MPEGYGYTPEGIARYRKDQEQKRTLGSTDAPRITASPSPVRPRVQRKTDPRKFLMQLMPMMKLTDRMKQSASLGGEYGGLVPRFAEILANLGGELGRKSDQDLKGMRRMIPSAFDTQPVSQDKLWRLGQFSKSLGTLGGELGRKSDVDVRRVKRRNKVPR